MSYKHSRTAKYHTLANADHAPHTTHYAPVPTPRKHTHTHVSHTCAYIFSRA